MTTNRTTSARQAVVLTNTLVQKLVPRSSTSYDVRDAELKGFLVRVFPSGKKSYRCQYGRGKHYTIGRTNVMTATQARREAMNILAIVAKGIDPKAEQKARQQQAEQQRANSMTLAEFFHKEYAPWYETTHPKSSHENIKAIARNFLEPFGDMPLTQITQSQLEKWRIKRSKTTRIRVRNGEKVKETISPATINHNLEKLSALFNKAMQFGYLQQNPVAGIKKLKVEQPNRIRFLSQEEYCRLLTALEAREETIRAGRQRGNAWREKRGYELYPEIPETAFVDHLKPMVLLALGSGIRLGSLIRLEWDKHIDLQPDHVTIQLTPDIVKTAKGYEVPLDPTTAAVLRQWHEQTKANHQGTSWVFPGKNPGQHITTVKKAWKKLLADAGIENFTWHDQRHDFASQHVMSGTDLYTVMELLGHSDPKMTKRYAHLAKEHKLAAAKKLAKRRKDMSEEQ